MPQRALHRAVAYDGQEPTGTASMEHKTVQGSTRGVTLKTDFGNIDESDWREAGWREAGWRAVTSLYHRPHPPGALLKKGSV